MKVLVAEDDPTALEALVLLLDAEGHEAVGARTGTEAVRRWKEAAPEVAILDYRLPDMTGLEVLAKVRADAPRPRRVFLLTGQYLSARARRLAAELGVRVFRKPIAPGEFLRVVRRDVPSPALTRVALPAQGGH